MATATTGDSSTPPKAVDWLQWREALNGQDRQKALEASKEIQERLDILHSSDYSSFLEHVLPLLSKILNSVQPKPSTTSTDHLLRHSILELISRLPNNDVLRVHAPLCISLALRVLQSDYEENALLASRIIFDLHKNYRTLQDHVQVYLDFCHTCYRGMPQAVSTILVPTKETPPGGTSGVTPTIPLAQPPSKSSFRVLTECPLTVMLLFQLYPKFLKTNIPTLIQLMMDFLGLKSVPNASRRRNRELVAAQVKTLSFLTFLLRGFAKDMKHYEERLSSHVISLLQSCPRESLSTRKELLVAIRHILATDFRRSFLKHIDVLLLDDRLLLGRGGSSLHGGESSTASLKPLAYSTLADLVHHVRPTLHPLQLSRVVSIFSRVLHDRSLPVTLQVTAVRLLLNLVDTIFHQDERDLLGRILHGLVHKLGSLRAVIRKVVSEKRAQKEKEDGPKEQGGGECKDESDITPQDTSPSDPMDVDEQGEGAEASPTKKGRKDDSASTEKTPKKGSSPKRKQQKDDDKSHGEAEDEPEAKKAEDGQNGTGADSAGSTTRTPMDPKIWSWNEKDPSQESLRDLQSIVRSIFVGLKTVIWCANNFRAPSKEGEDPPPRRLMTVWERDLVDTYVEFAIPCLEIFIDCAQYRDVLSYFAASLTVLDSFNFRRLMDRKIDLMVGAIVKDHQVMVVPRHLLNSKVSYEFCGILLLYVMDRMSDLTTIRHEDFCFVKEPRKSWDLDELDKARREAKTFIVNLPPDTDDLKEERKARASVTLELMERVLKSLSSHPENEGALRPHLRKLVGTALRSSMETYCNGWPDNYCILLRCVFRSISAGKFEESYKELLPLIPTILNGLYRIFQATEDVSLRNTVIELCLTIPARLSSLLPHMSLLLRMIIPALQCNHGDLVNLGLRTLEFWIDNLNPEFLYPILSKQTGVFTDLMTSLSEHLRPAPYPYGLLTLRLLGKLGGKNRRFLREPFNVKKVAIPSPQHTFEILGIDCAWSGADKFEGEHQPTISKSEIDYTLPLPLRRAVDLLRFLTASGAQGSDNDSPKENKTKEDTNETVTPLETVHWGDRSGLWESDADKIDLDCYSTEAIQAARNTQSKAAFEVVKFALEEVVEVPADESWALRTEAAPQATSASQDSPGKFSPRGSLSSTSVLLETKDEILKLITRGLLYASLIDETSESSLKMLRSFLGLTVATMATNCGFIERVDANGCKVVVLENAGTKLPRAEDNKPKENEGVEASQGKQLPAEAKPITLGRGKSPFGYFNLTGPFQGKADPLVVNEAIADFLADGTDETKRIGKEVFSCLVGISEKFSGSARDNVGVAAYFEHLLSVLCHRLSGLSWNLVGGIYEGVSALIEGLGHSWAMKYEVEIIQVALMAVKKVPREIPYAGIRAFQLFTGMLLSVYGSPTHWKEERVDGDSSTERKGSDASVNQDSTESIPTPPTKSNQVLAMLINELASTKHLVRFSARYALKHHVLDAIPPEGRKAVLSPHLSVIKRLLFTRSLRLLPLPEQVGVIEALSVVIDCVPGVVPLSDQQLLGFLSEFLKMSSVVDGEMSDANLVGFFATKNGYATSTQDRSEPVHPRRCRLAYNTALFLRHECVAKVGENSSGGGSYVMVPGEQPIGVQLRVSALRLFRAVIRRHSDEFFDAESTTPVGNIRPHVISLLFRSLVSSPPMSVVAAHEALRDVLSLSVVSKDEGSDRPKSHSRLPKELLQTCIRPVLLNLRDYTRLTVPLLRGLARLLSLLSSWFNKTLGEKLLEHLQKWTDPDRIKSKQIWAVGEEPLVAGAILELFALLPHASNFVEPLVKTTIKLEAVLLQYKACKTQVPYRLALARYLNKHYQHAATFFFQRLQNPIYSDLFQELLLLDESGPLRTHLSGKQCSINLLNVCFERPLAIIRSEKSSGTSKSPSSPQSSTADLLLTHGVGNETETILRQRESRLRQELESKQKSLVVAEKDAIRSKELLRGRLSAAGVSSESLEEAKRKHKEKQGSYDRLKRDYTESKQKAAAVTAQLKQAKESAASVQQRMTKDALELQHQGFRIVETLAKYDDSYLSEHNDAVRAFRWLWRSKGRHIRLQHQHKMNPRFHEESSLLAGFLVKYAAANPNDVDVLFELLRIFLQPTTSDFTFVRQFLCHTVSDVLGDEDQAQVMQRFYTLIAGEGPEETKVLSIQLIIFPMLMSFLTNSKGQIQKTSVEETSQEGPTNEASPRSGNGRSTKSLFCPDLVRKFTTEVLYAKQGGKPVAYGDRVLVELLKVSTLILEYAPETTSGLEDDLLKFSWRLLKADDVTCKNWAYVNVCKHFAVFKTDGIKVLDIYTSLLKSFQHEGRDLVLYAMQLLVPTLKGTLSEEQFEKVVHVTTRIMYEEGNSMHHMAHVFSVVAMHSELFAAHKTRFIRHIVNSLNRLGLPPTCPIENRMLSLKLTELILDWTESSPQVEGEPPKRNKKRRPAKASTPSPKRQKIDADSASHVKFPSVTERRILDQGMIETIANFLVRMKILLTDAKIEGDPRTLDEIASKLLQRALERWRNCNIRPIYFEKVVSMCRGEPSVKRGHHDSNRHSQDAEGEDGTGGTRDSKSPSRSASESNKSGRSSHSSSTKDEPRTVNTSTLSACLDVFIVMVEKNNSRDFLSENSSVVKEILEPCFRRAGRLGGSILRKKLQSFLVPTLTSDSLLEPNVICRIKALLEGYVLCNTFVADHSRQDQQSKSDDQVMTLFALRVIEEVTNKNPSFVESFTSALLSLANVLVKIHSQEPPTTHGQPSLNTKRENAVKYTTPTAGVLASKPLTSTQDVKSQTSTESPFQPDLPTSCLVRCLRLLGNSQVAKSLKNGRQRWLQTLSSILDSASNVQVAMTAVQIVGKWILSSNGSNPLSAKETRSFVWKIAAFDNNSLPPIAAQPLSDVVAHVTLLLHREESMSDGLFEDSASLLSRLVVAGMFNPRHSLRRDLLRLFLDDDGKSEKTFGPVLLLWRLLHTDFQGLCNRMWPTLFVETMLTGSDPVVPNTKRLGWLPPLLTTSTSSQPPDSRDVLLPLLNMKRDRPERYTSVLDALCVLAQGDECVSQMLLEPVLAAAWKRANDYGLCTKLLPAIENLLSRPYHVQLMRLTQNMVFDRPPQVNALRSFMQAVSALDPVPLLDSTLLVSIADGYGLWHEVLELLCKQEELLVTMENSSHFLRDVRSGVRQCLKELGEKNLRLAFASRSFQLSESHWAISLDIQGMVKDSISGYEQLIDFAEKSEHQTATEFEMTLWENQWVLLQREMSQLMVVDEFAKSTGNSRLMLECAWKLQNWEKMKQMCTTPSVVGSIEDGEPTVKMCEIFLSIKEGRLAEVENLHAQTAQLALNRWQLMPAMAASSPQHVELLHTFHRLVELRESGQIMVEASNHSKRKTLPDLKNLLTAWRHRLPNDHDNISSWEEIMEWRSHMFGAITSNFSWSEASALASLHDRPWTAIRMAETARNHGLREVALASLSKLTDCAMDVSDAFSKLREQILTYDNPLSDVERSCGLNLVNTTNLGFFDNPQKSELFRLKAKFLSSLGGRSKANQAYCHAVQVCPSYAKAWVSWGSLCTSLGRLAEKQLEQSKPDPTKIDQASSSAKKVAQYLAQALGCYLEAIQCDPNDWSRLHLAKCLGMLSKDGSSPGVLCQTLENRGPSLPAWVWLPWCPQLLTCLYRNEGNAVKTILSCLVKTYPQALYFPLRAFYLERRDVERSRGSSSAGHMPSVAHSEELMSALRRAHASLWSSLESILEELIVKFRPSYEEELLATTSALVERAESQSTSGKGNLKDDEEAMVSSVSKTLGRISAKFFREIPPEAPGSKRDDRSKKTAEFTKKYKAMFEADFLTKPAEGEKRRLSYYLERLKKWKKLLHAQVSTTPTTLPLVECSTSMAMFTNEAPDLWPMACDPRKSGLERERSRDEGGVHQSSPSSAVAAKTAAASAAFSVARAAALEGCGGEYGGGSSSIEIPGQYVPNTSNALDCKPAPELHPKLVRFETSVYVIRRNESLVRRIGMVGSDGRVYRYLLQFAIPYWTRTDERTAQIHYLVDKILRKDLRCAEDQLSAQPTPVIPIAQRLRMTAEEEGRFSLDMVYKRHCEREGVAFDNVLQFYQDNVAKKLAEKDLKGLTPEEKAKTELSLKVAAYNEIVEQKITPTLLLDFLKDRLDTAENLFNFRRTFAGQLAASCLFQHGFCVVERTPSRTVFLESTGQVLAPEFRFSYNNQGFLESQRVPFRFTHSLREALGPMFLEGRFIPSMAMIAAAIKGVLDDLDPVLRLLLRDDIIAWYTSKSMAKSDSKTQELEKQLADRVSKNVSQIQVRTVECAPRNPPTRLDNNTIPTEPVNRKVRSLIDQATSAERLCMLPATYQPWL